MQIRENGVYIEAIKLAAGSVQYKDISVKGGCKIKCVS